MTFLHPLLALGALLFLGPLLIHLLNRQRYRRVAWAAMRFLLAAHKRTRRRIQLQNLLLLLLRCAAIILLAFGLARLFIDDPGRSREGARKGLEHLVLVVDASYSMGQRERGTDRTLFDSAVEIAQSRIRALTSAGGEVTIILGTSRPRVLANPRALSKYHGPSCETLDLGAALRLAITRIEQIKDAEKLAGQPVARHHQLLLLSDLQRSLFYPAVEGDEPPPARPAVLQALSELGKLDVQCRAQGVGNSEAKPTNVSVSQLRIDQAVSTLEPTIVQATISNFGSELIESIEPSIWLDGNRQRTLQAFPLGPGQKTVHLVRIDIPSEGYHALELRLTTSNPDDLERDNRRAVIVQALRSPRVLIVNGSPARASGKGDYERDAALLLESYLGFELSDGGLGRFRPEVVSVERWRALLAGEELAPYRVICLSNLASLPAAASDKLAAFIASGGGLVVFLGDRLSDADSARQKRRIEEFNAAFAVPRSLAGEQPPAGTPAEERISLLPGSIQAPRIASDRRTGYYLVDQVDFTYPAFRGMAALRNQPLIRAPAVFGFFEVAPYAGEQVRVAARYDFENYPFLLEQTFGAGRCVLITTGASLKWNELWRIDRTAILFFHDLFDHLARPLHPPCNLLVHQAIRWRSPFIPKEVALTDPDRRLVDLQLREHRWSKSAGLWNLPVIDPREDERPESAGVYRMVIVPPPEERPRSSARASREVIYFAKNVDPAESDLTRANAEQLARDLPQLRAERERAGAGAQGPGDSSELSTLLLWAVFLMLVVETVLNALFSRSAER